MFRSSRSSLAVLDAIVPLHNCSAKKKKKHFMCHPCLDMVRALAFTPDLFRAVVASGSWCSLGRGSINHFLLVSRRSSAPLLPIVVVDGVDGVDVDVDIILPLFLAAWHCCPRASKVIAQSWLEEVRVNGKHSLWFLISTRSCESTSGRIGRRDPEQ